MGPGVNVDTKLRNAFGVFVKPKYNFGPAEVFARVGYARVKVKATACLAGTCVSDSDSDGDIAWGFGAGVDRKNHAPFEARFGFPLVEAWAMTETPQSASWQNSSM